MEDLMKAFIDKTDEKFENQDTAIQNLERQIANLLSERTPGTLPSNTEKNPKETIKVVSLSSVKTLTDLEVKARPEVVSKQIETPAEKESEEQKSQSSGVQKEIEEKVLTQMPAYAKLLNEILSIKRKLEETIVVNLNAHYSAILQNKIPQKCGDPGSFTIPFSLGSETFDKALCDSGASINLMHLSVFRKLEGEL
nr:uncharacterized protein LOC104085826 [Nicotiana tomentosiformis]